MVVLIWKICFFALIMPKIMLAQSAKANLQVTLPFLQINPQNNQDFENDPLAKWLPQAPQPRPFSGSKPAPQGAFNITYSTIVFNLDVHRLS